MSDKNVWSCPNCNVKIKGDTVSRIKHIGNCIGLRTINKYAGKKE